MIMQNLVLEMKNMNEREETWRVELEGIAHV